MVITYIIVFLLAFIIDIMYVIWIKSVNEGRRLTAAVASVLLAAPAIFGYMEIFGNRWSMVPYLSGLFFGTLAGMELGDWFRKRKNASNN